MRAFSRFVAVGWILLIAANAAPGADGVRWEADYETAVQKAAQQNRLVLVHFWSDGCPPCEAVERNVFPSPQVAQAINTNYVAVKVHAQRRRDLAQRFGVQAWPTDVIVTPAGQKVGQYISPQNPNQYSHMMHQVAAREAVRLGNPPAHVAQASNQQPSGRDDRNSSFPLASQVPGQPSYDAMAGGEFPFNQPRAAGQPTGPNPYDNAFRGGNPMLQQPVPAQHAQPQPPYAGQYSPQTPHMSGGLAMNSPSAAPSAAPQGGMQPSMSGPWQNNPYAQPTAVNAPAQVGQPPAIPQQAPQVTQTPPVGPAYDAPAAPPTGPRFAVDGYCVVSLVEQLHLPVEQQKWRKGDPRWGAVHRGQTYLFAGPGEQQRFLANPDYYTPVLSGHDPVLFLEQGQLLEGRREFGFTHEGKIYMFASEANLQKFWGARDMFISRVQQAMNSQGNPQRR